MSSLQKIMHTLLGSVDGKEFYSKTVCPKCREVIIPY
jgi:hypothetical protein